MTKSWRPEGWKNPYNLAEVRYPHPDVLFLPDGQRIRGSYANAVGAEGFEAGADAMLKALKKDGTHFKWSPIKCADCGTRFTEEDTEYCHRCLEMICPKCGSCGCKPKPEYSLRRRWE